VAVASLALTFGILSAFALIASAAASFTWTSQSDFLSGRLTDLDASTSPGDLLLARTVTDWARSPANPVFGPGTGWEADWVDSPTVLYEGGLYKMWYQGCVGVQCAIGYATSSDGVAWTRYPSNPVYTGNPFGWDQNLGNPVVIHDGALYKMWYAGDGPVAIQIGYATSPDGISWTRYGSAPVLSGLAPWDSATTSTPVVVREGSTYTMYFSGHSGDYTYRMGRATSPDGINWTEDPANPLMSPDVSWEESRVHPTGIVVGSSGYELYYTGGFPLPQIGHATSTDGRTWTRDAANPVLRVGASGAWDGAGVAVAKTVTVGSETRMYFGGTSGGWSWRIGVATFRPGGAITYAATGVFASAVVDSGTATTSWDTVDWSGTVSAETGIGVSVWVGNTSMPDFSWSSPSPPVLFPGPAGLHLPRARFAQVVAAPVTLNASITPRLDRITLTYREPSPPPSELSLIFSGGLSLVLLILVPVILAMVAITALLIRQSSGPAPPRPQAPAIPTCVYCGAMNPLDHRFCMNCGRELPLVGPMTWH